ncbi:hypothetical protein VKT23_008986 [Stygiomarasmius scandens]|uniref:Uncharacterized protein n=1 Tax=Marasmiellus scandens TaxID=2682957 RepID=A0ABR1JGR7_9AGAR
MTVLCENGADPKAIGIEGTALHTAAGTNHLNIVKYLHTECGIDINEKGVMFGTALQKAIRYGCLEVVQYLLENGADVNAKANLFDLSALGIALWNWEKEKLCIAEILQEYGATLTATDRICLWFGQLISKCLKLVCGGQ